MYISKNWLSAFKLLTHLTSWTNEKTLKLVSVIIMQTDWLWKLCIYFSKSNTKGHIALNNITLYDNEILRGMRNNHMTSSVELSEPVLCTETVPCTSKPIELMSSTLQRSKYKYSHGDTRGRPPCSVLQLLQSVHLMLWVVHGLPGLLDWVDGSNEVQVVFVWPLLQPGKCVVPHVRFLYCFFEIRIYKDI